MLGWVIAGVLVAGIAIGILLALRSVQWADELDRRDEE